MSQYEKAEQAEIDAAIARQATPMHPPSSEQVLLDEIAHWDNEREVCLNGLVAATDERIRCSRALNDLRHSQGL